jgi:endonuclease/exonuclease/phosphatase family metal-dependent hydrolase
MRSFKKLTLDDILNLETGTYYVEIKLKSPLIGQFFDYDDIAGYQISQKSSKLETLQYIRDTALTIGLEVEDFDDDAERRNFPQYINETVRSILAEEYTEPILADFTLVGKAHKLDLKIIPRGTVLYKGITPIGAVDNQPQADGLSFYTFDPNYAMRYAIRGGIGGLCVFQLTEECRALQYTVRNLEVLMSIIKNYDRRDVVTLFSRVFNLLCLGHSEDVLAKYIYWQYFHKLDTPWKVNKYYIRKNSGLPSKCPERQYGAKMDRITNVLLLKVGKLLGFDCTLQTGEYSTFAYLSKIESEIIFSRDYKGIARMTSHQLDFTNWGMDKVVMDSNILLKSIRNHESANAVYKYFTSGAGYDVAKYHLPDKKKSLRVCTYNIHGLEAVNVKDNHIFVSTLHRLIAESDVDICFLQETPVQTRIGTLVGYDLLVDCNPAGASSRHSARITVSAYCKKRLRASAVYKAFSGAYNYNKKGYLEVHVSVGRGKLVLLGCHLSIYVKDETNIRAAQLAEMTGRARADVILGDFNETLENIKNRTLANDYNLAEITTEKTTPYNKVDHIFVNRKHKIVATHHHRISLSDHIPVLCDIEVGDN